MIILGLATFNDNFRCDIGYSYDKFAIYLLQIVAFFVAVLNLYLTFFILRAMKSVSKRTISQEQDNILNNVLGENKDAQIKRFQIRVLSIGLFTYSLLYAIIVIVAYTAVYNGEGFE